MIKSNIALEKKSLIYAIIIFLATSAALFILYTVFSNNLPTWFIIPTAIAYLAFSLYNAEGVMGMRNAALLKIIAATITFTGEALGVNFGLIFGSYNYTGALGPELLGVPIVVVLVWDIYIYVAYMLSLHIVNVRFSKNTRIMEKFRYSLLIAIITGLATTAADLIIDPVAVTQGWWTWHGGGSYFPSIMGGVPISNFFGWIFLSSLSIFIFKFFFEKPFVEKLSIYETAAIIPYIGTFVAFMFMGHYLELYGPTFVGGFAMSIFLILYLITALQKRERLSKMEAQ